MVFVAIVSVVLFSGQGTRPAVPEGQRLPAQPQRQETPPKPTTPSAKPASTAATLPTPETPLIFWLPKDIKFPEGTSSRNLTLFGDPRNAGLYVSRTLIPKGVRTLPHCHPDSRTVTVISGVCFYGHGDEFDESRMVAMPPGSFFTEPAGVPHFIWAKEGDVVVQTTAIGPSGTQIIPEKKPSSIPGRP